VEQHRPDVPSALERRLTAILSADVHGYSRLMGDDEPATVKTIMAYREVMTACITNHRGRVVDFTGDSLLAEFASVVDAIECAVMLQQDLATRNAELPEERRMQFRIGINLGEVLVEGDQIYGDEVNIAARIQALADAGGICVSGMVHDQVGAKVVFGFDCLGEHSVKNIAKPVTVYRVNLAPPTSPATGTATAVASPSPDIPSIAVLPFENVSTDPDQEHFSIGLSEDLITELANVGGVAVAARSSVFAYKGTAVNVQAVGRDLGVRYVLEGSVRKAGERIRVTAQLSDAGTGHHVWAERYDRVLDDAFALQDELVAKIVGELVQKLTIKPADQREA
jgi:TolB-like protein/class 3 adenylate cyclase